MHRQGSDGRNSGGFNADEELPALHTVFHGQVASVQKYGVFVAIPGFRRHGLVHVSQMSTTRIEDPGEMLSKGEKVHCKIISVETEGSKIGLSMKLVNQTTGEDLDPNNVQLSQDEKKRRRFFGGDKPPIELGATYNTKCRNCGGHGHLALECFVGKGGKQYDLVPNLEDMEPSESDTPPPPPSSSATHTDSAAHARKKKKKKEKKQKKEKKRKRRHHSSASEGSDRDSRPALKKKKRHHSESSDSSGHEKHKKHKKASHKHRS